MNKKVLGIVVVLMAVSMLATPLIVYAKPTIKDVDFRIEVWPADPALSDWSKFKSFSAGESENSKFLIMPIIGMPPLIDDIPSVDDFMADPFAYLGVTGGVRFTIGTWEHEGMVEGMLIHLNYYADGTHKAIEQYTFTFDDAEESTLEILSLINRKGEGKLVGTRGTGYFEGAKFAGSYDKTEFYYPFGVAFVVLEGEGEIMLK